MTNIIRDQAKSRLLLLKRQYYKDNIAAKYIRDHEAFANLVKMFRTRKEIVLQKMLSGTVPATLLVTILLIRVSISIVSCVYYDLL